MVAEINRSGCGDVCGGNCLVIAVNVLFVHDVIVFVISGGNRNGVVCRLRALFVSIHLRALCKRF